MKRRARGYRPSHPAPGLRSVRTCEASISQGGGGAGRTVFTWVQRRSATAQANGPSTATPHRGLSPCCRCWASTTGCRSPAPTPPGPGGQARPALRDARHRAAAGDRRAPRRDLVGRRPVLDASGVSRRRARPGCATSQAAQQAFASARPTRAGARGPSRSSTSTRCSTVLQHFCCPPRPRVRGRSWIATPTPRRSGL